MAGFVIWLVIIFAVVAINKRNVQMRRSSRTQGMNPSSGSQGTISSAGAQNVRSSTTRQSAGTTKKEDPWAAYQYSNEKGKQQALKERLAQKYNRPVSDSGDILSRAKASVEKDFDQTWEQEENQRQRQREQKERQRQAKEQLRQDQAVQSRTKGQQKAGNVPDPAIHDREVERSAREMLLSGGISADPGDFMGLEESVDLDSVWDLMVKGPNLELTFERDFLAEGLEMLNRIQM